MFEEPIFAIVGEGSFGMYIASKMVRGQTPTSDNMELKSGPWSPEEDQILVSFVQKHGHRNWLTVPKLAGEFILIFRPYLYLALLSTKLIFFGT